MELSLNRSNHIFTDLMTKCVLNADYLSSLVCMRTKSTISISEALQTNFCRGRIGSIKVLQNFDQNHLISLPPPPPPPLIVE